MRKIKDSLKERMKSGDLAPLLSYVKSDNELRLEVRTKGEAFIYYRKGKALEIGSLKADKKYGNVPDTAMAIKEPSKYFKLMKEAIDNWQCRNKERAEFDAQQKVASLNYCANGRYFVIDMEYAFEQNRILKENREKRGVFDLLGLDTEGCRIVFFEVKRGMGATKGKSGIEEHIVDFQTYLFGRNSKVFKKNLIQDIKSIVKDKSELGLIPDFDVSDQYIQQDPELIFVFYPDEEWQVNKFKAELNDRYKLIIVNENSYKLG